MVFLRPFLVWAALGFAGVAILVFGLDLEVLRRLPDVPELPDLPMRLLLMVQPTALFAAAVAAGVGLSGKVGLWSWVTDRLRGETRAFPSPVLPIIAGLCAGLVVGVGDTLFFRWLTGEAATSSVEPSVAALIYGGITEELMLRYGLMTLLFWGVWKVTGQVPGGARAWAIIIGVALVFGLGHLPAMASAMELTAPVIIRTIALNSGLALLYGWLYWRRGLEAGMMAHMATHPGLWLGLAVVS